MRLLCSLNEVVCIKHLTQSSSVKLAPVIVITPQPLSLKDRVDLPPYRQTHSLWEHSPKARERPHLTSPFHLVELNVNMKL